MTGNSRGWCFFLFLWLPTVLYPALLARHGRLDWGPVAAGYLGIALVGALFIAAGTFASALTKNQIVAAIIGFVIILAIFLVGIFKDFATDPRLRDALSYLNLIEHMEDFARGIVDTRRLVYVGSTAVFFLFLATRALDANKGGDERPRTYRATVGAANGPASASPARQLHRKARTVD
jgi:ABC-2 type transport system permease protein